jgi:hypothetical protein
MTTWIRTGRPHWSPPPPPPPSPPPRIQRHRRRPGPPALAARGPAVAQVARREDRLDALAAELRVAGGRALPVAADMTDAAQAHTAVERTVDTWGRLDIMVHNVGVARDRTDAGRAARALGADGPGEPAGHAALRARPLCRTCSRRPRRPPGVADLVGRAALPHLLAAPSTTSGAWRTWWASARYRVASSARAGRLQRDQARGEPLQRGTAAGGGRAPGPRRGAGARGGGDRAVFQESQRGLGGPAQLRPAESGGRRRCRRVRRAPPRPRGGQLVADPAQQVGALSPAAHTDSRGWN